MLAADARDEAADEISYVIGPEAYDFFVTRAGWSAKRYRAGLERRIRSLFAQWATGSSR